MFAEGWKDTEGSDPSVPDANVSPCEHNYDFKD